MSPGNTEVEIQRVPKLLFFISTCLQVHCLLAPNHWEPAREELSGGPTLEKVTSSVFGNTFSSVKIEMALLKCIHDVYKVRQGSWSVDVKTETTEIFVDGLNSDIDAIRDGDQLDRDSHCEEDKNSKDGEKRGRGKPKRNYSEEAETPVRRGRGRPKKIKSVDDISLGEATDGSNGVEEKGFSTYEGELDEDFHVSSYDDSDSDYEVNGGGGGKRKKRGISPTWAESIVCADCGETVVKGRGKNGGKSFLSHQMRHKVEQFFCECPGQSQLLPETERSSREFVLKERHMKVEHMGWAGCSRCDKSFETDDKLEGHTRQKHAEIKSEEESSGKQKRKRRPNVSVKWPKDLLCPDCGENIGKGRAKDGGKYILRHQLKHQVENFVCECPDVPKLIVRPDQERVGKDFILKERHMKTVHLGWFGCTQCIQSFETEESLVDHREKHNLTFICDLCGFTAETKSSLKQHTVTKHVSNPVPCPDCGKHFANESLVKAHKKKVHTASPCPVCGVVIKNIRVHMEEMHIANSDKRFHCEDCGKGFMTKQRFESHRMNNHIKSQPHRCRYCKK